MAEVRSGRLTADHPAITGAGGVRRRQFLQLGGLTLLGAAALAACADDPAADGQVPEFGAQLPTTTMPEVEAGNVTYLRTATSIELMAAASYATLLADGHLTTEGYVAMVEEMAARHTDLARSLQTATRTAGGVAATEPNPRLTSVLIGPALEAVSDEVTAMALAHQIEELSADTHQRFVALVTTPRLRTTLMSVGAVSARHAALLALTLPYGAILPPEAAPPSDEPTTTAATTTTVAGTKQPDPVYAAASSYGSTATAAGPSAYV